MSVEEKPARRLGWLAGLLAVAAIVITALVVWKPWVSTQTGAPVDVRIASFSRAIDYAPYLVAKAQGRFEEALRPLNAVPSYQEFGSLADLTAAVASNRVDVIFQAEPPAIITRAGGSDLRIVGLSCSLRQEILVPQASRARSIADLRGATIAVLAGTSSHYGVFHNLSEAGLRPSDVRIADLTPPNARAAFEAGQVGAWAVWPPFVEQEIVAGRGRVLPGGTAQIQSVVTMTGPFVDNHQAIAVAIVRVLAETKQWMNEHPDEAQGIIAEQLGVTPEVVALAWPKHDWSATLSPAVMADLQAKADFLLEQHLITSPQRMQGGMVTPLAGE